MTHEPNVHGDLERELRELGRELGARPTPDVATAVRVRLQTPPAARPARQRPRRRTVALGIVAALVVALAAAPARARNAVLHWLHIPGVTISQGDPGTSRPPLQTNPALGMGIPVTLSDAQQAASFDIRQPSELGDPSEVLLGQAQSGATVTLVYPQGPDLPRARETGVGALLSEFLGGFSVPIFQKIVYTVPGARRVSVRGGTALWISGPQDLILATSGRVPFSARRAANSLLWVRDGVTYRLEADVSLDHALQIATSVP